MPDTSKIVSLFDDSLEVKFYSKKHQYYRRINKTHISTQLENGHVMVVDFSEDELGQWVKLPSTTTYTKSIFDKPKLQDWMVNVSLDEYINQRKAQLPHKEALGLAKGARWKKMREAGKLGSEVHDWIERFINYLLDNGPEPESITQIEEKKVQNGVKGFLSWFDEHVKEPIESEKIVYHPELDVPGTLDLIFINKDGKKEVVDFKTGNNIYPGDVMQLAFYRESYHICEGEFPEVSTILHINKDKSEAIPFSNLNHEQNFLAFSAAHYLTKWKEGLNI